MLIYGEDKLKGNHDHDPTVVRMIYPHSQELCHSTSLLRTAFE